jgi:hypothetical protein
VREELIGRVLGDSSIKYWRRQIRWTIVIKISALSIIWNISRLLVDRMLPMLPRAENKSRYRIWYAHEEQHLVATVWNVHIHIGKLTTVRTLVTHNWILWTHVRVHLGGRWLRRQAKCLYLEDSGFDWHYPDCGILCFLLCLAEC